DLTVDESYAFVVRASCGDQKGEWTDPVELTMELYCAQPDGVELSMVGVNYAEVEWEGTAGAMAYNLEWYQVTSPETPQQATVDASPYHLFPLDPNTGYIIRVQAV